MLNKPGLFGQNDRYRRDTRGLEPATPATAESARTDTAPVPAPEPAKVEAP